MTIENADAGTGLEQAIRDWRDQAVRSHEVLVARIEESQQRVAQELVSVREELAALRRRLMADAAPQGEVGPGNGRQSIDLRPEAMADGRLDLRVYDGNGNRMRMGEILAEAEVITREQLEDALNAQHQSPQRRLGAILVEKGYTGEDVVAQVLASQLNLPFVRLTGEIDPEVSRLLPAKVAQLHRCVAVRATDGELVLAMANPLDLMAIDDVELATRRQVAVVVATSTDIDRAIDQCYGIRSGVWF